MVESIFGCKWSVGLLRLLADGCSRPSAILRASAGLSAKVMNERLRKMLRFGIVSRTIFGDKASEGPEIIDVHILPFVQPVDGCRLALIRRSWNHAIVRVGASNFECGFTAGTWDNVAGLIEPFCEDRSGRGYQRPASSPGEADLLLTTSGKW